MKTWYGATQNGLMKRILGYVQKYPSDSLSICVIFGSQQPQLLMSRYTLALSNAFTMKVIAGFVIAFSTLSCENLPEYSIPEHEIFRYSEGDTLVFKDQGDNYYYLIIDVVYNGYTDYYSDSYPYSYQRQEVYQHFQHEEHLLRIYDSIRPLFSQCEITHSRDYCDSLYNLNSYNMRIVFATYADGTDIKHLEWKNNYWLYPDRDYQDVGEYILNGVSYKNVYKIVFSETIYDSITPHKYLYFNYRDGILMYENKDSEVLEFYKKL